ncbi:MAG: hypothetical protein HYZ75_00335 [Elusimicrobia bacterium]|nr:hypothetical protein [Elusimicrobiota bacterium]
MTPPKGKSAGEQDLLVDLGSEAYRTPPDIPTLKEKEKEKKGGGVVFTGATPSTSGGGFLSRWFGVGGGSGGSMAARGGIATVGKTGLGVAGKGFGPMFVNFLASNLGTLLLTGIITGGAVYTLYSLGMSAMADAPAKTSVFPSSGASAAAASSDDGEGARVDASGLSYFQTANSGGAFADPELAKVKDGANAEKVAEVKSGEETKVPDAAPPPDGGPQIADALAKTLEKPKMIAGRPGGALGKGNGLAGGSGLAGGMTKKFDPQPANMGKVTAPMRRGTDAKLTARRMSPVNRAKGGSMGQLKVANGLSRKALGSTSAEGQSFTAAEAFNTAPPAQGAKGLEAGMGAGTDGSGVGPSDSGDGGPLGTANPPEAPQPGQQEDKSPYSSALMAAMALLMTASSIILIIGVLALIKNMPIIGVIATMWQKILYGAAIGMAASASAIGAMVAGQQGQKDQGLMVTIGGAITAGAATAALAMPGPTSAWVAVLGGIAGIGASIGSLLLPMMKGGGAGGAAK